jgi:hypothetical protein
MAGYAVNTRIERVTPRLARRVGEAETAGRRGARDADRLAPIDLAGRPIDVILAERWDAIRERWAQATFFLFDPDSWR